MFCQRSAPPAPFSGTVGPGDTPSPGAPIAAGAPGFLHGLWDGFIFPFAWFVSFFVPEVAIYAVPNNGGWYDFGYFLGVVVFGVGARGGTRIVYRTRTIRETSRGGVVEGRVIREEEE